MTRSTALQTMIAIAAAAALAALWLTRPPAEPELPPLPSAASGSGTGGTGRPSGKARPPARKGPDLSGQIQYVHSTDLGGKPITGRPTHRVLARMLERYLREPERIRSLRRRLDPQGNPRMREALESWSGDQLERLGYTSDQAARLLELRDRLLRGQR